MRSLPLLSKRLVISSTLTALVIGAVGCDSAPDRVVASVERRETTRVSGDGHTAVPTDPDPTTPTEPTDPVDPTDPGTPTGPTDPVDPTDPTDPADPNDPVDPVGPAACESGVICVESFPYVDARTTFGGADRFDRYSCAPATDESGPEVVYRVDLPEDGLLVASLDDVPAGVDVDVHILDDLDSNACRDRGHWNAAAWLGAGTYYVVVDSWVNTSGTAFDGDYRLTLGLTRPADFEKDGLDAEVFAMGLHAFDLAWRDGETERLEYTVIDFSLYSGFKRLWTVDLRDGSLLFAEPVTHGEGSEDPNNLGFAYRFSNIEDSHQSSLGMMLTGQRYNSSDNGLSMRMSGLEDGINDQVWKRAIVVHSDPYASASFLATHGYLGNSWGCQVIDPAKIADFIGTVENGTLMWSYFPDDDFLRTSVFLEGF
jgi:hypothetical protein